jgi:hypothetical protein
MPFGSSIMAASCSLLWGFCRLIRLRHGLAEKQGSEAPGPQQAIGKLLSRTCLCATHHSAAGVIMSLEEHGEIFMRLELWIGPTGTTLASKFGNSLVYRVQRGCATLETTTPVVSHR